MPEPKTSKLSLPESAARYLSRRDQIFQNIKNHPEFRKTGKPMYGSGAIGANLPRFVEFFELRNPGFLEKQQVNRVLDIAGADGDIAAIFALAGYETTVIDLSLPWSAGPLIESLLNEELNANLRVIDLDVDRYFTAEDLRKCTINPSRFRHSDAHTSFDLILCTGLLYHLKNPIAFLESVHQLTRFLVLGTWSVSYLPDQTSVHDVAVAYLVDPDEMNHDSTNFWVFSHKAFQRLAERCGFAALDALRVAKDIDPANSAYAEHFEQEFLLLQAV